MSPVFLALDVHVCERWNKVINHILSCGLTSNTHAACFNITHLMIGRGKQEAAAITRSFHDCWFKQSCQKVLCRGIIYIAELRCSNSIWKWGTTCKYHSITTTKRIKWIMETKNDCFFMSEGGKTGTQGIIIFIKHTCHFASRICDIVLECLCMLDDYWTKKQLPRRDRKKLSPQPLKQNKLPGQWELHMDVVIREAWGREQYAVGFVLSIFF